jgi:hypothetical protein
MRIRRSRRLFESLASRFSVGDEGAVESLVAGVKSRGYLTRDELLIVCRWKSPRPLPIVKRNGSEDVEQITACALGASNERLRIGAPLLLQGVSWPTASVLLHFFHSDPYPVLDFRAVWSVGFSRPAAYTFEFWWEYVMVCRGLSESLGLPMRTVDRALWQYSKENA